MATGRASAQGRRAGRTRTPRGHVVGSEQTARAAFPVDAPVLDARQRNDDDATTATDGTLGATVADEPTDEELDARARALLEGMPALEDLVAERVPLTLVADLVSPFGPDSARIAREERDR